MRKPISILTTQLTELQQAQLAEWLLNGTPYHVAQGLVEKEFKVRVKSLSSFSGFWEDVCQPQLLVRRSRAVSTANAVREEMQSRPGEFQEATIDALSQKAFELSINPGTDPKDVKAIFALVLKAQDQSTDAERLKLERERFQFDAAKAAMAALPKLKSIVASKLSEGEKVDQVRTALFGVLPK